MQDLAVLREIASLDEAASAASCDGEHCCKTAVEEIAPLAEAMASCFISALKRAIECNGPMLHRAIFVLLDEMIARAPGSEISISIEPGGTGFRLSCAPAYRPAAAEALPQADAVCRRQRHSLYPGPHLHHVPENTIVRKHGNSFNGLTTCNLAPIFFQEWGSREHHYERSTKHVPSFA